MVEPAIGLAGDTRHRRPVVVAGGVFVAASLVASAVAPGFGLLLAAQCVGGFSAGAFVSLSQASLMDLAPGTRERNMARWMVVGSLGAVTGPLVLAGATFTGRGWREVFVLLALCTLPLLVMAWRAHAPDPIGDDEPHDARPPLLAGLKAALRDREVLRWLLALETGDLLGDVLLGFLALYLVDVAGASAGFGGFAVAVWSGAGIIGGAALVRLTRTMDGARYLRVSAPVALALYPAFLLVPSPAAKVAVVAVLGVVTAGWYPIAQARLFASLHGRSGTAIAVSSLTAPVGLVVPVIVAAVATAAGLQVAMWLLLAGPIALFLVVPRAR